MKKGSKTARVLSVIADGPAAVTADAVSVPAESPAPAFDLGAETKIILAAKERAGQAIYEIGAHLLTVKANLPHGEWLTWLTESVNFSERTAERFMRLVREWDNPTTLSDLGASRALALLSLPEPDRAEFLESHDAAGMSVRELREAIAQAKADADKARADADAAQAKADAAQAKADAAESAAILAKSSADTLTAQNAALAAENAELKNRPVDVAVREVPDEKAIADAVAQAKAKADKELAAVRETLAKAGNDTAKAKADALQAQANAARAKQALSAAEADAAALREKIADLEKSAEADAKADKTAQISADADLALFGHILSGMSADANRLTGLLAKIANADADKAAKLRGALSALAKQIENIGGTDNG